MNYTKIKFKPTGNIFNLPVKDAEEILKTDRGNYEIVGGVNIPKPTQTQTKTSTFKKVVVDESQTKAEAETEKKQNKKRKLKRNDNYAYKSIQ